jgi:hypothetical protein
MSAVIRLIVAGGLIAPPSPSARILNDVLSGTGDDKEVAPLV